MLSFFVSHNKRWWISLLLLGFGSGATVGILLWGWSLWQQVVDLRASVGKVTQSVTLAGFTNDPDTINTRLGDLMVDAEALQGRLAFLQFFYWIPVVGEDLRAVTDLISSGIANTAAAQEIITGLNFVYGFVTGDSGGQTQVQRSLEAFLQAEALLAPTDKVRLAPNFPMVRESYQEVLEIEAQLGVIAGWGKEAGVLLRDLVTIQDVDVGEVGGFDALVVALRDVVPQILVVREHSERVALYAPMVDESLESVAGLFEGLDLLVTGMLIGLEALDPVLDHLSDKNGMILQDGPAMAVFLSQLQDGREAFVQAAARLEAGQQLIVAAGQRVPIARVDAVHKTFQFLADFALVAPDLVGLDGQKRYLVLGHTADELRATGGYVATVWLITFRGGELVDVTYKDTVEVDDLNHLNLYPIPPHGLHRHMLACCWLLRDVSWEPDFPSTARLATEIYQLGQGLKVDGVIAVNQWTLQRLVDYLGGLRSPNDGKLIRADQFQQFLQEETDKSGRGYSQWILPQLLWELQMRSSAADLVDLAGVIWGILQEELLFLYVNESHVQSMIEQLGWDGSVAMEHQDYLRVVDSNVGWSKVDRNILRSVSYQVALDPDGSSTAKLSLQYQNSSGVNSTGCELQWMSRGNSYQEQLEACYWNYLRVYLPSGANLISNTPLPLPAGAIYAEYGSGTPGEETLRISTDYGKVVLGGVLLVPPGQEIETSFLYQLPETVLIKEGSVLRYSLTLQKQPGVLTREIQVVLNLPAGYEVDWAYPEPVQEEDGRVVWQLGLDRDMKLEMAFSP